MKSPAIIGYLVIWDGGPMREASRGSLREHEVGRLFVATGFATMWPTRSAARAAMRRAIKAWGRNDGEKWHVKPVRGVKRSR